MYDYAILGAGITGLTLLEKLRTTYNVIALEKENDVGGLCRTFEVDGHYCDIGGHFFQTKYKDVEDFIFNHFPKENMYQMNPRISKINIHGIDIDYPLEANLWQLPQNLLIEYLISVIRNGEGCKKEEPKNYEQWIRWKLGDKICDNYLEPYNSKLWGVPSNEMDIDWLSKIPRIEVEEILRNILNHSQDIAKYPAHSKPYYPKKGGYGNVISSIARDLYPLVKCNFLVSKLVYNESTKTWIINNVVEAKNVINTIPWTDLYVALGEPIELREWISKIKYNKLVISLFELKELNHNYHWRYIPDMKEQHHRELFISNFVKNNKKYGVFTETNSDRFDKQRITFKGKNIFNYETDAAYPLPLIDRTKAITEILNFYKNKNLFGVGRWGEHQHLNHDVCIKHALDFANKLTKGK